MSTQALFNPTRPDWLGELPHGWLAPPLRRLARIETGRDYKDLEVDTGGYPVMGSGGEFARASACLYEGPSVLLGRKGTVDQPRYIDEPFWAVDTSFFTRIAPDVDPRFFFYVSLLVPFGYFEAGTALPSMTKTNLYTVRCPLPPEDEQHAIADFLDRETEKIDSLVARKERLIELLLEERTALISRAVTKGLDPNAPTKDSGIAWFGPVPAHWPVARLGYFARVLNGSTPPRNNAGYWLDGTVPWLASAKVNEDRVSKPSELITEAAQRECSLSFVPAGSVLIGLVGQGRTRGMAALLDCEATINQNMAAIIPRGQLVGRYVQYQIEHMYRPIREYSRGGNQAALNCELVADLRVPVPPLDEQAAIARFLDGETDETRRLIDVTRASIDLLRESRSALITAAVTGQIDVREYSKVAS
jgi:type I restriction enzyme S subunit